MDGATKFARTQLKPVNKEANTSSEARINIHAWLEPRQSGVK